MTDAKYSVTLKAGTGFDSPWIVFYGETAQEIIGHVKDFAAGGGFGIVRGAAAEFQGTDFPQASGEALLQAAFPGAVGVPVSGPPEPPSDGYGDYPVQTGGAQQIPVPPTASGYQPQPRYVQPGQAYQQGQPQADLNPPCQTCGGPTKFKSGTGNKGPWSAYFCINTERAPRDAQHKPAWNK